MIQSSYGLLRCEPYGDYPEHEACEKYHDPIDGETYVQDTILWVLKRVSTNQILFDPSLTQKRETWYRRCMSLREYCVFTHSMPAAVRPFFARKSYL